MNILKGPWQQEGRQGTETVAKNLYLDPQP